MKMKINVKALKVPHFEIEVDSGDTVDVVKQKIEDVLGSDYPKARQLLISQGNFGSVRQFRSDGYDPQLAFDLFHEAVQEIVDNTGGDACIINNFTRELAAALNNLGIRIPEARPASPSPASSQASNCPTSLDLADTGSSSTSCPPLLSLNQIFNTPQFQQMCARIQHKPAALQQILDGFVQECPILFNQIQTRPIDFLWLMRDTEQDGLGVPSEEVVSAFLQSNIVTPEDRVTIDQKPVIKTLPLEAHQYMLLVLDS